MVEPESIMVRTLRPAEEQIEQTQERFTSLQPTYEDSVPDADDAWQYEE